MHGPKLAAVADPDHSPRAERAKCQSLFQPTIFSSLAAATALDDHEEGGRQHRYTADRHSHIELRRRIRVPNGSLLTKNRGEMARDLQKVGMGHAAERQDRRSH
jgi:hypothetical protein